MCMALSGAGRRITRLWYVAAIALAGCVTDPFAGKLPPDLDRSVAPDRAVSKANDLRNQAVLWGGEIVSVHNLKDTTEIAVLAYPLDSDSFPDVSKHTTGRFIVRYPGFLDPLDYGPGRLVTVLGRLDGVDKGKVGEAPYTFPVVKSSTLHLWSRHRSPRSNVMFGIGVGIGF